MTPVSAYSSKNFYYFSYCVVSVITIFVILLVKDKYDDAVSENILIFSFAIILIFGAMLGSLLLLIARWFGNPIGPLLFEMQIYERANRLKKEANLILAVMFILVIGAAVVFFKASSFARDDVDKLFTDRTTEAPAASDPKAAGAGPTSPIPAQFAALPALLWARIIMVTAVRVGDIAVASFLTFMLVRIYRYNLRLSAFYYSRADAIVLSSDTRFKQVKREALPVLLDANFDFGKDHPSLVADFAQLMGALHPPRMQKEKRATGREETDRAMPSNKRSR